MSVHLSGPARLAACAVAFSVMAILAFPAAAQEAAAEDAAAKKDAPKRDWLLDHETVNESVEGMERVVVINHHGNVRLQSGAKNLDGQIVAQYSRGDSSKSAAEVTRDGKTLRLEVVWKNSDDDKSDAAKAEKRRIDVGFAIPPGLAIEVETRDGELKTKNLDGPLVARSAKGDMLIRGSHAITAESETGAIRLIATAIERGPIQATSGTGRVRLDLPEGSGGTVELMTRGPVTTDFSVTIESEAGSTLKKGVVELGGEGAAASLQSTKGGVRLGRLIVD